MGKKTVVIILALVIVCLSLIALYGCQKESYDNWQEAIFATAKNAGYTGTIEDLVAGIEGKDGASGKDGIGIQSIEKTATEGLVDTYTITLTNAQVITFTVTNGANGTNGTDGRDGADGADGTNGINGTDGANGTNGTNGKDAEVELRANNYFYIGNFNTGVSVNDCAITSFAQAGETLEGDLRLEIINRDFFGKVAYSISRMGALGGEEFIINNTLVESDILDLDIVSAYHGDFDLKVKFYNTEDSLIYTAIRDVQFKASHYNIYYLNATLPVLLATTEIMTDNHTSPTYMLLDRYTTYDWAELPANTYRQPNSTLAQKTTNLAIFNTQGVEKTANYMDLNVGPWEAAARTGNPNNVTHTRKWVKDLYNMDKTSTFTFGCVDNSVASSLIFSYGNGIPKDSFDIKIYSDGTGTNGKLKSSNLDSYATWQNKRQEYQNYINTIKNNPTNYAFIKDYSYVMCIDDNVQYITNSKPGMLNAVTIKNSPDMTTLYNIYNENVIQLTVEQAFANVNAAGKISQLERLLKTRWTDNEGIEGSAAEYFNTDNGKPSLMILGTSEGGETGNAVGATFMELMDFVIQEYGDTYNVLYKGHPAWPIGKFSNGTARKNYFTANNIVVLPNATPAETYMYLYDNVFVGGYYSTTFTSSKVGQTICFFGKEANIKGQASIAPFFDTTAEDYLGIFENSVYIDKSYILANS